MYDIANKAISENFYARHIPYEFVIRFDQKRICDSLSLRHLYT